MKTKIKSSLETEVVVLPAHKINRLIQYSNTYYKKYGARLIRYVGADAYTVQYLLNIGGDGSGVSDKPRWENAFHVNKQELDRIFAGDTIMRKRV